MNIKFLMLMKDADLKPLLKQAKIRGITLQEQLRAVVIPEWLAIEKYREKRRKK